MDTSSEIVHGLLPVFLVTALGASYSTVGMIEGVGEATALVLKVVSGPFSDWWGKRKPLVLLGYTMGALSKPLFALAPSAALVLGARIFDRTGKGIRGAPRDALIAASTPRELMGRAYGLRQSLDNVGAFLGPLIAIGLMQATHGNYRLIFWLAVLPGLLCVLVLLLGVDEPDGQNNDAKKISWSSISEFRFPFWLTVIAAAIFQLARFSEAFLILRAQNLGLALPLVPVVLVVMNVVYALTAYPVGWLSDRVRREWLLAAGCAALIFADLVLANASGLTPAFLGIAIWGLHMGLTQGVFAAMVADRAPESLRGTAFGLFNLFSAAALFLASATAGALWDKLGPAATFQGSAVLAAGGALILGAILLRSKRVA